jgi:S1-C subfamily serine protease
VRLGIKEDDVLISVNGQRVDGADSIRRALRQVQEGSNVNVEVARPGEGRLTLEARKGPRDRRSV